MKQCKFCSWAMPRDFLPIHKLGFCSADCKETYDYESRLARKYVGRGEPLTHLETKLYDTLHAVKDYLTGRTLNRASFTELMGKVMQGIKAYENKKYGEHVQ